MKCVICKEGQTQKGKVTVTLEREGKIIVFKLVPADVCATCQEEYLDSKTSGKLLQTAEEIIRTGVEFDIREFKAA